MSKLLKAYRMHGRDCRFAVNEAFDGGITILTSAQVAGAVPSANGVMLTLEERLALTLYLMENPPKIQPLSVEACD